MYKRRIGFGANAFKIIEKKPLRKMKRLNAIHAAPSDVIFFDSEEHHNILKYDTNQSNSR